MTSAELARCRLAIELVDRSPSLQLRAMYEAWNLSRIVRELY